MGRDRCGAPPHDLLHALPLELVVRRGGYGELRSPNGRLKPMLGDGGGVAPTAVVVGRQLVLVPVVVVVV